MTKLKKNSALIKLLSAILFFEIFFSLIFLYRPIPHAGWLIKSLTTYDDQKMNVEKYNKAWDYKKERYKPGIHKNKHTTFSINNFGFRGIDFNKRKNSNGIRIIAYGDSLTVGIESPDNLTYPFQLEKKLKERNINFEVLNFGAGNRTLSWIYELILMESKDYYPDYIAILNNYSSAVYDSSIFENSGKNNVKNKFDLFILKFHKSLSKNIMIYRGLNKIYKRLYVKSYLGSDYIIGPYEAKKIDLKYFEKNYYDKLNSILKLGRKNKFKLILIEQNHYINSKFQKKMEEKNLNELLVLLNNFNKTSFEVGDENAFLIITNAILNKQLELLKKNNPDVILVKTTNIYRKINKEKATTDGLHLTPYGNSIIAEEVAKKIFLNLNI